ncbi:MAG: DNA polymerase IV [Dehalococcoidia bacterium]|nr:DNA polymerase IV [Dehalococcoidia bacterium]
MARTILHADLDAFYASVEQLDRPELRGRPVVVGGPPEARGVVAAASYEARRFGIHSAMPMSRALRLCPQAVRVSPRFGRYGEVSRQVMSVFRAVTPLVEPLSLDEAFLDVTAQVRRYGGAEALARRLKRRVKERTGLTVSVGAGTNKTVAKIASDMQKPDGLVIVAPGAEEAFLAPLPARALWGVGPRAESVLAAAGLHTIGDIAGARPQQLEALFGARGLAVQEMARGRDDRAVETEHERKSVGAETTFPRDLADGPELREQLARLANEVAERLSQGGSRARTVVLKLRYADFHTITRQTTRPEPTDDAEEIESAAAGLLDAVVQPGDKFRLLGIHGAKLGEGQPDQLSLWSAAGEAGRTPAPRRD